MEKFNKYLGEGYYIICYFLYGRSDKAHNEAEVTKKNSIQATENEWSWYYPP